jgi:hypothetical protein
MGFTIGYIVDRESRQRRRRGRRAQQELRLDQARAAWKSQLTERELVEHEYQELVRIKHNAHVRSVFRDLGVGYIVISGAAVLGMAKLIDPPSALAIKVFSFAADGATVIGIPVAAAAFYASSRRHA